VGDPVYGGGGSRRISGVARRSAETLERAVPRQALHAAALAFRHPITHAPVEFHAEWPADLRAAFLALGAEELVARPDPLGYLRFFNRDG
jgi:23S rRNA pseudouridine1911/1915/1917 synthase